MTASCNKTVVEVCPAKHSCMPCSTNSLGRKRSICSEASTRETDLDRTDALLIVFIINVGLKVRCHFIFHLLGCYQGTIAFEQQAAGGINHVPHAYGLGVFCRELNQRLASTGSIALALALVAGKKRVPRLAMGKRLG